MEIMVTKNHPTKLFSKTSHLIKEYDSITLKRLQTNVSEIPIRPLNSAPINIPKRKYEDLVSLCQGDTPVVKMPEYQEFFRSLPHEEE